MSKSGLLPAANFEDAVTLNLAVTDLFIISDMMEIANKYGGMVRISSNRHQSVAKQVNVWCIDTRMTLSTWWMCCSFATISVAIVLPLLWYMNIQVLTCTRHINLTFESSLTLTMIVRDVMIWCCEKIALSTKNHVLRFSYQLNQFVMFGTFSGTCLSMHGCEPIFYCNLQSAGAQPLGYYLLCYNYLLYCIST